MQRFTIMESNYTAQSKFQAYCVNYTTQYKICAVDYMCNPFM